MKIYIDADGCPVVNQTISIAHEHNIEVVIICDTSHRIERENVQTIVVDKGADSADFRLVNMIKSGDIAVTQDYGLAAMCLSKNAVVLNQDGKRYSEENISGLLEFRAISKKIRNSGGRLKGMPKRTPKQDVEFEAALKRILNEKTRTIQLAEKSDTEEILALYRTMLGGKADWNENYPSLETIEFDLSRSALFVMKNEANEIISAISIDSDEEVEKLTCWNPDLQPSGELSRLCVRKDMQNQGIARQMMQYTFDIFRSEGKKSVHILVRKGHNIALKSYMPLGFAEVGECNLFEKDFICLEMKL